MLLRQSVLKQVFKWVWLLTVISYNSRKKSVKWVLVKRRCKQRDQEEIKTLMDDSDFE